MAAKSNVSVVQFLALHFLFLTMVSSCGTCTSPTPAQSSNPNPSPNSKPTPTPTLSPTPTPRPATCPRDALKFGVCANLLRSLVNIEVGSPPVKRCCSLIQGLADLEAAVCLCTAIRPNALGMNVNLPVSLSLLLGACGKQVPNGFQCG